MSERVLPVEVKIETADGPKRFFYSPIKRRDAVWVHYQILQKLAVNARHAADIALFVNGKSEDDIPISKIASVIGSVIQSMDFDDLWNLGRVVLRNFSVRSETVNTSFETIDETDYFDERPEEFYIAVINGVRANFPNFFGRMAKSLSAFGLSKLSQKDDK